jgi:hypothetical protein
MRWLSPISFNPYAKLFFTADGGSTVVLGKVPSFDVELGAVPTGTSIPAKFLLL